MENLDEVPVRQVMNKAASIVNSEMNRLHDEIRDRDGVIANQQQQIRILREEAESEKRDFVGDIVRTEERQQQDFKVAGVTLYWAITGWVVAFVSIGYVVWLG